MWEKKLTLKHNHYMLWGYGTVSQMVKIIDKDLLYHAEYRIGKASFPETFVVLSGWL